MNKPINYPKRTKLPYELGSIENQHYSASLLDPEAVCWHNIAFILNQTNVVDLSF